MIKNYRGMPGFKKLCLQLVTIGYLKYTIPLLVFAIFIRCTQKLTSTHSESFMVACDTITLNDSSWYQPVIFRFTPNYIHHTNNFFEDATFHILEKGENELFVESEQQRLYMVGYDLKQNGYISFKRIGRVTYFRILSVVDRKQETEIPIDSTLLTSERY
jgi:hypothetical protein